MVIVAHDVEVPAFTEAGERDTVRLKAGTPLQFSKSAGDQSICFASVVGQKLYYVVPSNELQISSAKPFKPLEVSFEDFSKTFIQEKEEFVEEGAPEEAEEARGVIKGEPAKPLPEPGLTHLEVPSEEEARLLKGEEKKYIGPENRFMLVSEKVPTRKKNIPPEQQPYYREYTRQVKEKTPEGKEVYNPKTYRFFVAYKMIDTHTGSIYPVGTEGNAYKMVNSLLAREAEEKLPEFNQYIGLTIQKVKAPEEGLVYNILAEEKGAPLNPEPLPSYEEAKKYVDANIESLFLKTRGK